MRSATDRLEASIARIEALEPTVHAWQHLALDLARGRAKQLDEAEPTSVLHGVPIGVKDVFDTKDMPTGFGFAPFANRRPTEDAWVVNRLRDAGTLIVGKTVSTEFAYFHPGKTSNPHSGAHTPGGSSSGSAAAVGAGMVPIAIGTQTAGSTLRPAAYCGVFGFKPTYGLIPLTGTMPLSPSLDTIGLFASDIDVMTALFEVLNPQSTDRGSTRRAPPRIGVVRPTRWPNCDEILCRIFNSLESRMEANGQSFEDATFIDCRTVTRIHRAVMAREAAIEFTPLLERYCAQVSSAFHALIAEGLALSDAQYTEIEGERRELAAQIDRQLESFDFVLMPSAPGSAPLKSEGTGSPDFNRFASLFGLPAINVPLVKTSVGLPIGVQLVARRHEDLNLLAKASSFSREMAQLDFSQ